MADIERRYPKPRRALLVAILATLGVAAGVAMGEHLFAAALFALANLWQMAPIVLAGLLVTAVLTATGSIGLLVAAFHAREFTAIVTVSMIGAVLPVCGITLLPLVASLLGAGMALSTVMAFLLSSAVTDPSMFAVTLSTLGLSIAVGKTVAAFAIGLLGGGITWSLVRLGWFQHPARQSPMLQSLVPASACCGPTESQVHWQFWDDPQRVAMFTETCWGMAKLVILFLGAAFVAEYFLKLYLPQTALTDIVGHDNPLAVPIAALVAAPLYLDGYAALPLVRGLIDGGMAEGAAMAFLISGGIISAWTALPVFALVRLPVFLAYVVTAIVGSILSGWVYGFAIA